jgi:DNA-directed RNA polymerase subunit RPC12/RpoP
VTQQAPAEQQLQCPHCGTHLRLVWQTQPLPDEGLAGHWIRCPNCSNKLPVPDRPLHLYHKVGDHWTEATV